MSLSGDESGRDHQNVIDARFMSAMAPSIRSAAFPMWPTCGASARRSGRGRCGEFGGDQFDTAAHMDGERFSAGAGHGQRDHRHVLLECGDIQDLRPVHVDGLVMSVLEADHRGGSPCSVVKEI
jgi:hypothetical protein